MDSISRERRSWNMSRIRGADTGPERKVRSALHRSGYRFRLHRKDLPGRPDIVMPRYHTVIFVHGCFWHRHAGCRLAATPKTRREFWADKFSGNVERDRRNIDELKDRGWRSLVIWECEIDDETAMMERIEAFLTGDRKQSHTTQGKCNERC